jgi:hypothetical protein
MAVPLGFIRSLAPRAAYVVSHSETTSAIGSFAESAARPIGIERISAKAGIMSTLRGLGTAAS